MGKLGSIVGIPGCVVNRIRNQLSMRDTIASQLIRHYFSWLTASYCFSTSNTVVVPLTS